MITDEILTIAKIIAFGVVIVVVAGLLGVVSSLLDTLVFVPAWFLTLVKAAVDFTAISAVYKLFFA